MRVVHARPGVDERDEVLHKLERASTADQAKAAGQHFRQWLSDLEVLDEQP